MAEELEISYDSKKTRREFLYNMGFLSFTIAFNSNLLSNILKLPHNPGILPIDLHQGQDELINTDMDKYRGSSIHFVGVGEDGKRTAIELSRIYEGIREDLFYEEYDIPQNHLHIHSYPCAANLTFNEEFQLVILAGSFNDSGLHDAREAFHERHPFLMLTIGTDYQTGMDKETFQPFPDEFLVVPDQSLFDPVAVAQLVLQIFLIHTLDTESNRGSMAGYDLADTKYGFAGKTAKVITMTMDKEHLRQDYTNFLAKNSEAIKRTQGILMTFWGLSLKEMNELSTETMELLMPIANTGKKMNQLSTETLALLLSDIYTALTFHDLPDDEPVMATLFFIV